MLRLGYWWIFVTKWKLRYVIIHRCRSYIMPYVKQTTLAQKVVYHWVQIIYPYKINLPAMLLSYCVDFKLENYKTSVFSLQWRHNGHDGVSNHQPHGCLLNRLFRRRSKKTSKLRVTGLCVWNLPGPVNSQHKWPVTRKMFPFDDVIMVAQQTSHLDMCFQKQHAKTKQWEGFICQDCMWNHFTSRI